MQTYIDTARDKMINSVICGNCLEILRGMPDNFVDMTCTSPPYDNLRTYNGYTFDFEGIARQLYRVTKQGGVVVWVVGDATVNGSETGTSFRQALYFMECGFNLHDTMIYQTNKPPIPGDRYQSSFEYMFVFTKGKINTFNPILVNISQKPASVERRKYKSFAPFQRSKKGILKSVDSKYKKTKRQKIMFGFLCLVI